MMKPNEGDRPRILIADDEADIRESAAIILGAKGYHVEVYNPGATDSSLLDAPCDVALLDMVMPGTDGFQLRERIIKCSPCAQFIIATGKPDQAMLEKAMDLGVCTFLTKPFTGDQLSYAVMGALHVGRLLRRSGMHDLVGGMEAQGLIGSSLALRKVKESISDFAPIEIPILITGESGTGKEVVARCLHHFSRRADKEFIAVNCAGLSPSLIESELFGHVQGAFTGATKTKHGFFDVADKATLFLDEIGELPLELQSKLLRVLDSGEYYRVGEATVRHADVRLISATNRDLKQMTVEKKFREDLYYRMKGASIRVPPLREHLDDIPAIVTEFLRSDRFVATPDAMELLQHHSWPGNVRELRMTLGALKGGAVNRVITARAVEHILGICDISVQSGEALPRFNEFKQNVMKASERSYFEALLQSTDGHISEAARIAGMDRKNLYQKLALHGLDHLKKSNQTE